MSLPHQDSNHSIITSPRRAAIDRSPASPASLSVRDGRLVNAPEPPAGAAVGNLASFSAAGQPSGAWCIFRRVSSTMEAMQAAQTRQQVAALYQAHALGLVKLAVLMVGDQRAAEDVVQDAFLGLYRRWSALQDRDKALSYVRASVLNGCRAIHRGKYRRSRIRLEDPGHAESAEAIAMLGEAHREVLAALRRLPDRQREAVVLRYYLDMTEDQAAQAMGVSRGTVKSATSRGIAALARMLKEES
jgi:RNA polymerase sigma-70 factor (sigma-E family)